MEGKKTAAVVSPVAQDDPPRDPKEEAKNAKCNIDPKLPQDDKPDMVRGPRALFFLASACWFFWILLAR